MRRFERLDENTGLQAKEPSQFRAGRPPTLPGGRHVLPPPGQLGAGTGHFHLSEKPSSQTLGAARQIVRLLDGVGRPGEFAAGLLDIEVRFGDGEDGVVLGRLQCRLSSAQGLPGRERREQGVRDAEDGRRSGARHQGALAGSEYIS